MAKITALTESTGFVPTVEKIEDTDLFVTFDFEGERPLFHTMTNSEGDTQSLSIIAYPHDPLEAGQARAIGINVEDLYTRGLILRFDPVSRRIQEHIVGRPVQPRVDASVEKGFNTDHPAVVRVNNTGLTDILPVDGAIKGIAEVGAPASIANARQVAPDGSPITGGAIVPSLGGEQGNVPNLAAAKTDAVSTFTSPK